MNLSNVRHAHKYASSNKIWLAKAQRCGCFYCLEIFSPVEITNWLEMEDTALCPYCSVDALLPESSLLPLSKNFLEKMHQHWFEWAWQTVALRVFLRYNAFIE
ncbi:cytoplasmic protein [Paenilisteria rocourtiae]|uniref:Cytoplasmic protein n=1 Tax=Listeria rocourtiae TaxID=647910 RepID=A0A4R6ZIK4_9LIST|nr:cytoplasmic protein [Listeria rocourtiae]EUJ44504.1 hypothetical protein PROCOU_13483 [Listeria rocourtiae FSL F6-920]TDR52002.1 hypothetical protein DFP96_11079 [Listeria rocourtiae]